MARKSEKTKMTRVCDEELRKVTGGLGGGRSLQQDMASVKMLDLAVKSEDPLWGTFFLAAGSV
jgi:hypothetical protein